MTGFIMCALYKDPSIDFLVPSMHHAHAPEIPMGQRKEAIEGSLYIPGAPKIWKRWNFFCARYVDILIYM